MVIDVHKFFSDILKFISLLSKLLLSSFKIILYLTLDLNFKSRIVSSFFLAFPITDRPISELPGFLCPN